MPQKSTWSLLQSPPNDRLKSHSNGSRQVIDLPILYACLLNWSSFPV
jgi:hypothetical protein